MALFWLYRRRFFCFSDGVFFALAFCFSDGDFFYHLPSRIATFLKKRRSFFEKKVEFFLKKRRSFFEKRAEFFLKKAGVFLKKRRSVFFLNKTMVFLCFCVARKVKNFKFEGLKLEVEVVAQT